MTEAQFWKIVRLLDWTQADDRAVVEPAVAKLAELPVPEIYLFDEFLRWHLFTLDTREHAGHFGSGERFETYVDDETPFSTDGFLYCRAMVIAKGPQFHDAVLVDPTLMASERFEFMLYVPNFAYERKTGQNYEYEAAISWVAGSNKPGWL